MSPAVERLTEPCRACGGPVYLVSGIAGRAKCSQCGGEYLVAQTAVGEQLRGPVFTPPAMQRRWSRVAWQAVALLSAATVVLALASLGLALPPRVMLAVGIAGGLCMAAVGVWIMAGDLFDRHRGG